MPKRTSAEIPSFAIKPLEFEPIGSFAERLERSLHYSREIHLDGPVDLEMAKRVRAATIAMAQDPEHSRDPILFVINSYGGSIACGFDIIGQMRRLRTSGIKINALVAGVAASTAAVIAAFANTCMMTPESHLVWHGITLVPDGKQDIDDLVQMATDINQERAVFERILLDRARRPGTQYSSRKKLRAVLSEKRGIYIGPREALRAGLIDGIFE
jgi:ATP-dependent protease ClpP protease subunit